MQYYGSKLCWYVLLLCLVSYRKVLGQVIPPLQYLNHTVIAPKDVNGLPLGGFSGIAYHAPTDQYVLVADKPPARLVYAKIDSNAVSQITWNQSVVLQPALLAGSELEGIAIDSVSGRYFVSDEQKNGTRIMAFDQQVEFERIVLPNNSPFLPLSRHNSGIEGLTLSADRAWLYYAFERPSEGCDRSRITTIGRINLNNGSTQTYAYQLHEVPKDVLSSNGISALLEWTDSTLLVMERAYIPEQGNIVRLFEVVLKNTDLSTAMIECNDQDIDVLSSRLVYDFSDEPKIKIDNAEGMCFNSDKTLLYIITDNNFSKSQETQLIVMHFLK